MQMCISSMPIPFSLASCPASACPVPPGQHSERKALTHPLIYMGRKVIVT